MRTQVKTIQDATKVMPFLSNTKIRAIAPQRLAVVKSLHTTSDPTPSLSQTKRRTIDSDTNCQFNGRSATKADANKLVPGNATLSSHIEFFNHGLELFLLQPFAEFSCHPPQILQLYPSFVVRIKELERSQNLLSWIAVHYPLRGNSNESGVRQKKPRRAGEGWLLLLLDRMGGGSRRESRRGNAVLLEDL